MAWPKNRFIQAKSAQELLAKAYALQKKGWVVLDYSDTEPFCAYLERINSIDISTLKTKEAGFE